MRGGGAGAGGRALGHGGGGHYQGDQGAGGAGGEGGAHWGHPGDDVNIRDVSGDKLLHFRRIRHCW